MRRFIFILLQMLYFCSYGQELDISADWSLGGGLQTALGTERTEWNRSPVFSDIEIMINTDNDPFFEAGASLLVPMENRMALGFVPKIKLKKNLNRINMIYAVAGVPLFIAGVSLFGFQTEIGYRRMVSEYFGIFGEGVIAVFPFGKDVMKIDGEGMMTQFNIAAGFSLIF